MLRISRNTAMKAAAATLGSVVASVCIVLLVVPLLGGQPDGPGFWMSVLCPLVIAGPVSAWQFHQTEIIAKAHAEIADMHRELDKAHFDLSILNAELERKASFDGLTGALNRETFFQRLDDAARQPARPVALLIGDADHFKRINDEFGHQSGDEALRAIADVIGACVRRQDFWGRIGGEEFLIFVEGADRETSLSIANRIRERVAAIDLRSDGRPIPVSMSIGIACATTIFDPQALYAEADLLLYEAKGAGRNRVVIAEAA